MVFTRHTRSLLRQTITFCTNIKNLWDPFSNKESCVTISENENKIKFVCSVKELCDHF